ncbi:AAA family ATPase [Enterococcus casseliflavus]|uniref:AAA family ATPase n=1 Tax=Enterococcus casseliflavus TaxID=37734 RepID=UPI001FCA88A3|nr:ATP-binding protein [Enterococcus casseliflavus]
MNSDLFKIIEGGIEKDTQKVINYSKKLAEQFYLEGKTSTGKKIERIIAENNTRVSSLDSLTSRPTDRDTKVDLVDVWIPFETGDTLYFDSIIEKEIKNFTLTYYNRNRLIDHGIESSNNLLLYGPPGTGKSSLAKYIALQLKLPLLTVRMDGVISSLLGSTAKNIRKVFDYASKQPCILFLDEFDVIAKIRDDQSEIGELKRVVNSLIQNIDSFSEDSILIAATNHSHLLDNAVWRRFDKVLFIRIPEYSTRKDIIVEFSNRIENNFCNDSKKLDVLTSLTENFSPSQIKTTIGNSIKKTIVSGDELLKFSEVVYAIFLEINQEDAVNDVDIIKFLHSNNISQREIAEQFSFSLRKVKDCLSN